ncbi:MAG: membrane protein insertion efficiency factor YidD [Endomicrobium sp.]|jgi:putative membrane protein insertion efficiency factor|nr:membrane protein insertion efficiency factor YidD [Endomicrobium sp.]
MKQIALFLIKCYKFASQTVPSKCRFWPTCSSYAYQAIEIHGFLRGFFLIVRRIIRCHPFCSGGFDSIPSLYKSKALMFKEKL